MKRRSAFTLIELLVVVAIISLLIAILLPSLSKARKLANTTRCLTNVRALSLKTKMYVTDYSRSFMGGGHGGPLGAWDSQLLGEGMALPAGTTVRTQYNLQDGRKDASDKLRFCPETRENATFTSGSIAVGSAVLRWNCGGSGPATTGSYGFNGWLFDRSDGPTGATGGGNCGSDWSAAKCYKIKEPGSDQSIPIFADATYHDFWPNDNPKDGAPNNTMNPGPQTVGVVGGNAAGDDTIWRVTLNRHNKAINVSFLDGHAETVMLPGLWSLRWSRGWSSGSAPAGFRY